MTRVEREKMLIAERELTTPVSLTNSSGRLNRDAVGWSRQPLHDTSGIDGRSVWGRNKRWEYWSVIGPRYIVSLTISSIDYLGAEEVWIFDRETEQVWQKVAIVPFARGVVLPATLGDGPARAHVGSLEIDVDEVDGGTRLAVRLPGIEAELFAARPSIHESLSVVVPWSDSRFQYTVKDVARPASGTVTIDGVTTPIDEDGAAWAVLDHGRGRWPYNVRWNWGAGSGLVNGRRIGVQLGGQWTVGTGSTENCLFVDGRASKISEEIEWQCDPKDWLAPWRVRGETVDLEFHPFCNKASQTRLGVLATRTDQCFGHWTGTMTAADGERVRVDGVVGWAEDVHNRW